MSAHDSHRPRRILRPGTIRGRLARILVFSMLLVLALTGVTVAGQVRAYLDTGAAARAVSLSLSVQNLVCEVQRERGLSNGLLAGDHQFAGKLLAQRAATDRATAALHDALAATRAPGSDQVRAALGQLAGLAAVRAGVDAGRADRDETFAFYTAAIAALDDLRLGLDQVLDPPLRHSQEAMYALADAVEHTGQERGFLNGVFAAGRFDPGEYIHFTEIRAAKEADVRAFGRVATADQRADLNTVLAGPAAAFAVADEARAIAATRGPIQPAVDPATWWDAMTTVIDSEYAVARAVGAQAQQRAQVLRTQEATTLLVYLGVAALALIVEVLLLIGCLRGIVRPLAALSADADDVAVRRLPHALAAWNNSDDAVPDPPAPVRAAAASCVEIVSVAGALDRVQQAAFDLASQQALLRRNTMESLASLGRRNQHLVRRQLGFLGEIEQEELDPAALSRLFELDHLATRMRRNAESLLILAGEQSLRRWADPIPVSDVVRAGLSEVERYQRVVVRRLDDAWIAGAAVSELAHIIAELVENGLAYSSSDVDVEIYGSNLGRRYLLAVVDYGDGMSKQQLAVANARLRGEQDFLVAPTQHLGHFVVGKLAARLGIDVELAPSAIGGVVARLLLPSQTIADVRADALDAGPRQALAARNGFVFSGALDAEPEGLGWPGVTQ